MTERKSILAQLVPPLPEWLTDTTPSPRRRVFRRQFEVVGPKLTAKIEALHAEVRGLREQLGERSAPGAEPLLDRQQLADALSISRATVDRVRKAPSFPEHRVGDAPRFILSEVRHWLDKTDGGKALGLRLVHNEK